MRPYFLLDRGHYPRGKVVQLVYTPLDLDFERVRNCRHWQIIRPPFEGETRAVLADIQYEGDDAMHDDIVAAVMDKFATKGPCIKPLEDFLAEKPLITVTPSCNHCGHAPCGCGG